MSEPTRQTVEVYPQRAGKTSRQREHLRSRPTSDGGEKMVSPQASAIIAFGDHAADKLVHSDLPGVVIDFR